MAGKKQDLEGMEVANASPLMPMFEAFRDELDEHHDRRERIIKASRDITALTSSPYNGESIPDPEGVFRSLTQSATASVRQLQSPIPPPIQKEINARYDAIKELFTSVAPDLQGLNAWRYQRQISGGCQEYVEAISFQHYLETQNLITHREAQDMIPGGVELAAEDYVLGLFDLTGELMRFGITGMATGGTLPRGSGNDGNEGRDILADLRSLRTSFESLDTSSSSANWSPLKRDIAKKVEVMRESVEKVEKAVYGMIVRGTERPKGWVPDTNEGPERGREPVESY
ncbi:MAG: hypothetical protein LQ348_003148 [Seirophora lacunosa]|nr:MAG: hypothetical protein LQ348_003148 [Seirophora lacunosa]